MPKALTSRLAQVLLQHNIMASAELLTDLEQAVTNHKHETASEVTQLINFFCELKHRPAPQPQTPKQQKEYQVLYVAPMQEIISAANGRSVEVVKRTVEKMRRDGLTCGYPKQLVTCALSVFDEMESAALGEQETTAWGAWAELRKYIDELKQAGFSDGWIDAPESDDRCQAVIDAVGWRSIVEGSDFTRAAFVRAWGQVQ